MLSGLLAIVRHENGNWYFDGAANGIGEGLIYALIGFVVVFVGIVLIILIIWLLGLIMKKTDNLAFLSKLKIKKKSKAKPDESPAADGEKISAPATDGDVPPEVKAAIIAAIMAYYQEKSPECEFKVKRIKRL